MTLADSDATPTLGLVIVGAHLPAAASFVRCVLERRGALFELRIAVLALVGEFGAVAPPRRPLCDVLRRSPEAPHGGLSVATLERAASLDLEGCLGYVACRGRYRRLPAALRAAAMPSMVVVAFAAADETVRLFEQAVVHPERFAARCVVVEDGAPRPAHYVQREATGTSAATVLEAALRQWTGRLHPLVAAPASGLRTCLSCRREQRGPPLVCGGCHAVCYCSRACQLAEMQEERGLPHAAYCRLFREHARRDCAVHLRGAPPWLHACMGPRRGRRSACEVLEAIGAHSGEYTLFCPCSARAAPTAEHLPRLRAARGAAAEPPIGLASWDAYYAARGLATSSPVALLLSFALSLYHILCLAGVAASTEPVALHYLGPAEDKEVVLLESFRELAVLLPRLRLTVEMVGPAICARQPVRFGENLTLRFHAAHYHSVSWAEPPTLAVALNSGIAEYAEWHPTVALLRDAFPSPVPFYFTDYSESGLHAAAVALAEEHDGLRLSRPIELNPFRCPLERAAWVSDGSFALPWMSNGFVTAMNTA